MIKFTILTIVLAFFVSVSVAAVAVERFVDIGMAEATLLKNYGPPINMTRYSEDKEFGMNETKLLEFTGAKIDLHLGANGFYIWRLEIIGGALAYRNHLIITGIKERKVIEILGQPESIEIDGKTKYFYYHLYSFDAWTRITIEDDVVTQILASEDWA
jgi:hypothetical protein